MKKAYTLFTVLLALLLTGQVLAQGTQGQGYVFQVTGPDGNPVSFTEDDECGVYGPTGWSGTITTDFCAPLVWAYDSALDSQMCNTSPNDYTGKIVMIRRGACEFGVKALNAEMAGAIAVVVVNSYANATEGPCTVINMGEGAVGAQVTIPMIFACRQVGETLDALVAAGPTEACFLLPRVSDPFAPYAYATPKDQVDSLYNMAFNFYNRSNDVIDNLVIKADVHGPAGYIGSVSAAAPPIAAGADTFLYLPAFLPPSEVGEYNVVFSNNVYTESRDTLHRKFRITDYTYAVDNMELMLDGGADRNDLFAQGGFIYQTGAMYLTGESGGTARYVTFGVANVDSVYVPGDPDANAVAVLVYDGDSDGDGFINLDADWSDIAADLIGAGTYTIQGDETEAGLVDVEVTDFIFGGALSLQPFHPYYVSILYDGTLNGSGRNLAFSNTAHVDYLNFPTTPMFLGQFYDGGWGDRVVVQRLQMDGYVSTNEAKPNSLDAAKFSITPNPGNEFVNLNLDLSDANKQVVVNIMSAQGQLVRQEVLRNFQSGQVRFDVKDVPSGTYLMWIRTDEGQTIQKVAICH